MFKFFRAWRKRNKIRQYAVKLPPLLRKRYLKAEFYTPDQVRGLIAENKLSSEFIEYAIVLFCKPDDYEADRLARGGTAGYWKLRVEILDYNFRGEKEEWPDNSPSDGSGSFSGYVP